MIHDSFNILQPTFLCRLLKSNLHLSKVIPPNEQVFYVNSYIGNASKNKLNKKLDLFFLIKDWRGKAISFLFPLTFDFELHPVWLRLPLRILRDAREHPRVDPPHALDHQGAVGHDHAIRNVVGELGTLKKLQKYIMGHMQPFLRKINEFYSSNKLKLFYVFMTIFW